MTTPEQRQEWEEAIFEFPVPCGGIYNIATDPETGAVTVDITPISEHGVN